jgi:hypothetical protein
MAAAISFGCANLRMGTLASPAAAPPDQQLAVFRKVRDQIVDRLRLFVASGSELVATSEVKIDRNLVSGHSWSSPNSDEHASSESPARTIVSVTSL